MVITNTDKLTNFRNAFSHALQYPETSKSIVDLLLVSALHELGMGAVRELIKEFNLTP